MADLSLVIVGDAFVDRDISGRAERLVPDAPVPVVEDCHATSRPGGAGLAAMLAASATANNGAAVTLIAALGDDAAGRQCTQLLREANVRVVDCGSDEATACKTRVRAGQQVVARLDEGGASTVPRDLPAEAREVLEQADVVVVSDYGRGMSAYDPLRHELQRLAPRRPIVWDPHPRGARAVSGARLLTPNANEAQRLGDARPDDRGLRSLAAHVEHGRALSRAWRAAAVAVTLGADGAVLIQGDGPPLMVPTGEPAGGDACGAGDMFAVSAALALGKGALTSEAVTTAVESASAFVRSGGVGALRPHPAPSAESAELANLANGVEAQIAEVRRRSGVVVAAGGCFDLLHVGHIAMLHAARALGDYLVVCVNSDASVRRLKGEGRPIVGEQDRAALVGALADVDGVVLFDDPTPVPVLERLRPDVFVKGADYAHRTLPEEDVLRRWGGQVVVVPYMSGRSTTTLIAEVSRDG